MARKKEPCPFCEDEHYTNDEFHGVQLSTEVYPDNMLIGITATGTAEDGTYMELGLLFKCRKPETWKDPEWYRLYNLYQVIRYQVHLAENPTGTGVDSYPPIQFTDEPLPECAHVKKEC